MAEHDIDKLNIQIATDASNAIDNLDETIQKLDALDTALSKIDLSKISTNFDTSKLKTSAKEINSLKNSINNIIKVDVTNFSDKLKDLSTSTKGIDFPADTAESVKSFASGIRSMITAAKNLNTKVDFNSLTDDIKHLVDAIKPLTDEMIRGGPAISNYGTQMKEFVQAAKTANSINKQAQKKSNFLTSGRTFFGLSNFKTIAGSFRKLATDISGSIDRINAYVENMNLFTVAMGEYALRAQKFAQEMEIKLGVDSGEAMRYMGIFQQLTTSFGVAGNQAYVLSKNLTQLGYDLASFFNLKTDEAFLKLQSGVAGEIEPLRRIGIDISAARMQQELYALGIDKSVNSLSQADKALLRYIAIMKQTTNAQGDMGATLYTSANQMRVLTAQIEIATRWLGAIFIPVLTKALGWAIAFVKALGEIAKSVAEAFGFEMPEIVMPEKNSLSDFSSGLDDISDSANKTSKSLNNLIGGFDELNILQAPSTGAGDGSELGNILGGIELPEYDMFERLIESDVNERAEKIRSTLEKMLPLATGIGTAFVAWKLSPVFTKAIDVLPGKLALIKDSIKAINAQPIKLTATKGIKDFAQLGLASTSAAALVGAIALISAQFVNLYVNSESFRTGLERIVEIFKGILTVATDIGKIVLQAFADIGNALISLLPEGWQDVIYAGLEKISDFISKLDLNFGDLGLTIAGIALMFIPGGQLAGGIILAFEGISLAIRALGLISDEQWESIKTNASIAWDKIKTVISDKIDAIKITFKGLFTAAEGLFTGDFSKIIEGGKLVFQGFIDFMPNSFKKAINSIIGFFENFLNIFVDGINGIKSELNSLQIKIPEVLGGGTIGFDIPLTKKFKLQRLPVDGFANGGYPQKAQLFYARENGMPEMVGRIGSQTAVANNGQIITGISQGVSNANDNVINTLYAISQMIITAIENKDTDIEIDGRSVTRIVNKYQKILNSEQGNSLVNA